MEVGRITIDELRERLDRGEPIAMVDARSAEAWGKADRQIPGSTRVPPDDIERHVSKVPKGRAVVSYCT
jgi:rhodanese-related sulfurtransferase